MKQAILITAYRDMPLLKRLVEWFDDAIEKWQHKIRSIIESLYYDI